MQTQNFDHLKIKVLGAANEVGRSGFLVNCDGTNLLLDYGVMFSRRRDESSFISAPC